MSENNMRRESLLPTPTLKRRRRRRSIISVSSHGGFDEEEDSMMRMFESDEIGEDFEINNNADNDSVSPSRGHRRRRSRGVERKANEALLSQKINSCKELIDNLRNKDWKMSKKLLMHKKANDFVEKHEGKLSRRKNYLRHGQQLLKQMLRSWTNWKTSLVPWEMHIKRIESHFGSVVASYFVFLRWLLWISLWLAVLPLCFIVIPELLLGSAYGSSVRKKIPSDEVATAYDLKTIWNAEGVIKYSVLFYGYYDNSTTTTHGYRLPLAYFLTNIVVVAYSFIVVLNTMARNSRQNRMSGKDEEFSFSWKLFTEWDYMIGSQETAITKHASIVTTFKETIVEEEVKVKDGKRWLTVSLRVLSNVIILILLALSAYVIQLFVERSRILELKKRDNPDYQAGFWEENELTIVITLLSAIFPPLLEALSPLEKYHPRTSLRLMLARTFVLNLLNLYTLFIALYNKQQDLTAYLNSLERSCKYLNGSSTSVTNLSSSAIITTVQPTLNYGNSSAVTTYGSFYNNYTTTNSTTETTLDGLTSAANSTTGTTLGGLTCADEAKELCWETMIGQEVFKLTIMDTVSVIAQILVQDILRTYFVKYCNFLCCWDIEKHFPEYPEFKTAENLLALISSQGVIWLGALFSPGLPLFNVVRLIMLMYIRFWTVMVYTVPEKRIFRASRKIKTAVHKLRSTGEGIDVILSMVKIFLSSNFYYTLLLIMLFLCSLPPLFAIVVIAPSKQCGPFSGHTRMYDVITKTIQMELPPKVTYIIHYLASPGVIIPVLLMLGMVIYYLISISRSLRDANTELKMQLEYERTEGRRRVYAIVEAKHESEASRSGQSWNVVDTQNVICEGEQRTSFSPEAQSDLHSLRTQRKDVNVTKEESKTNNNRIDTVRGARKKPRSVNNIVKTIKNTPFVKETAFRIKQSFMSNSLVLRLRHKQTARYAFRKTLLEQDRQKQDNIEEGQFEQNLSISNLHRQTDYLSKQNSKKTAGIREEEFTLRMNTNQYSEIAESNIRGNEQKVMKTQTSNGQLNPVLSRSKKHETEFIHEKGIDQSMNDNELKNKCVNMITEHTHTTNQSRSRYQIYQNKENISGEDAVRHVDRLLSSTSMVDESGHLKLYDEITDEEVEDNDDDVSNLFNDGEIIYNNIEESSDGGEWSFSNSRNTHRKCPISRTALLSTKDNNLSQKETSNISTKIKPAENSKMEKVIACIEIINESGKSSNNKKSTEVSEICPRQYLNTPISDRILSGVVPEIKVDDSTYTDCEAINDIVLTDVVPEIRVDDSSLQVEKDSKSADWEVKNYEEIVLTGVVPEIKVEDLSLQDESSTYTDCELKNYEEIALTGVVPEIKVEDLSLQDESSTYTDCELKNYEEIALTGVVPEIKVEDLSLQDESFNVYRL